MRITVYRSTLYCALWGSQQRCSGMWRHVDWWIGGSGGIPDDPVIPEKGNRFLRNAGCYSAIDMVPCLKRQQPSTFVITMCCVSVRTCIIHIGLVKGRAMGWAKHATHLAYLLQESVPKDCGCEILPVVSHMKFGNFRASLWCVV
jgi:hypothetical protein